MAEYHIPVLELVLTMANAVDSLTRSYQLTAESSPLRPLDETPKPSPK